MLYGILTNSAERYADSTVVRFNGKGYTYSELCLMTDELADSLSRLGLGVGDRIGVFLYNRPEILVCYFACFKIGATVVPVNYRLRSDEIQYIVNHSTPTVLISERELFPEIEHVRHELKSVGHYFLVDWEAGELAETKPFSELIVPGVQARRYADEHSDTDAVILYTSGTTGNPKGTLLTHKQLAIHTDNHCRLVGYRSTDKTLVSLALSNNIAFSHQMLAAVRAGATLEILPCFDAHEVLNRIEQDEVTMLYMMPVM